MIKAIIFDKDGTLHDTERVFAEAWRLAADELDVPDIERTMLDCTGCTLPNIATYWNRKYPTIPFDVYLPRRQYHFNRIIADGIPLKEGARELLAYLREHGYRIGLATSTGCEEAMDHLRRTDMVVCFDQGAIVTGDMVERGKPAPDIFLLAATRLGVDPAACLGVEDSNNGVRSIAAAGMRPVMIPDTQSPAADVEPLIWCRCDKLLDLIPILENE